MQKRKTNFKILKFFMVFAVSFIMILAFGMQSEAAAPSQVTGLKQTGANSEEVQLKWSALQENDIDYEVSISNSVNGDYRTTQPETNGNDATIHGLKAGTTYYVKVRAYVKDIDYYNRQYGAFSAPLEVVTSPKSAPGKVKHTKSTTSSISLSWSKVSGANCYAIRYGKMSDSRKNYKIKYVSENDTTLTKLSKNEIYNVYVYGVRKTRNGGVKAISQQYKKISNLSVTPGKVSGLKCRDYYKNQARISVQCLYLKSADGYQWELYTGYKKKDTKMKTINTTGSTAAIKSSELKKYNLNKVRVRAYAKDSNGKKYYGAWCEWIYISPQPYIKMKSTSSGLKTTWNKIKGADRYAVYISTKENGNYKKYGTTTKTSTTIKKCGSSKLKSGKKYYVYVLPLKKAGGKYYSGQTGYPITCWSLTYRK